jgi:hypothetical protein
LKKPVRIGARVEPVSRRRCDKVYEMPFQSMASDLGRGPMHEMATRVGNV